MEDKMILMRSLVEQLNQASDVYYNGKGELMTDYEWDAKFDQLKKLEEETGEVLPDSPTNKVSEDTIVGKKEEHEFAALSLAKTIQFPGNPDRAVFSPFHQVAHQFGLGK